MISKAFSPSCRWIFWQLLFPFSASTPAPVETKAWCLWQPLACHVTPQAPLHQTFQKRSRKIWPSWPSLSWVWSSWPGRLSSLTVPTSASTSSWTSIGCFQSRGKTQTRPMSPGQPSRQPVGASCPGSLLLRYKASLGHILWHFKHIILWNQNLLAAQLSNLWWMPNSRSSH